MLYYQDKEHLKAFSWLLIKSSIKMSPKLLELNHLPPLTSNLRNLSSKFMDLLISYKWNSPAVQQCKTFLEKTLASRSWSKETLLISWKLSLLLNSQSKRSTSRYKTSSERRRKIDQYTRILKSHKELAINLFIIRSYKKYHFFFLGD